LSQIYEVGKPSVGKPSKRIELTWDDFVQLVLEITIQAYKSMHQEKQAQRDWEEDTFTSNLEAHLQPIALENAVLVEPFKTVITDDMREGKQSHKKANEIDLSLFMPWKDYDKIHFAWEAKKIGDKRIDKKYQILNSEYVNEAIYRFIRLKYAAGLSNAGILGYVLAGEPEIIVEDINQTMGRIREKAALPPSNHLRITDPIGDFRDIYKSQPTRTDSTQIELHHLLLCFDFLD